MRLFSDKIAHKSLYLLLLVAYFFLVEKSQQFPSVVTLTHAITGRTYQPFCRTNINKVV